MFKDIKKNVALFGGSFDPPHFGHKVVVETALKRLEIDKLIVIPTFLNPFKRKFYALPHQRFSMSQEIFKEFSDVIVDSYEIEKAEVTPTAITVKHFQQKYNIKYVIIGADNLKNINRWFNFEWLNSQVIWAVATRVGYGLDTSKLREFEILKVEVDISSTEIRKKGLIENDYR